MASNKGHIRYCVLSAFQQAAGVAKMIYYVLGKAALTRAMLQKSI